MIRDRRQKLSQGATEPRAARCKAVEGMVKDFLGCQSSKCVREDLQLLIGASYANVNHGQINPDRIFRVFEVIRLLEGLEAELTI